MSNDEHKPSSELPGIHPEDIRRAAGDYIQVADSHGVVCHDNTERLAAEQGYR